VTLASRLTQRVGLLMKKRMSRNFSFHTLEMREETGSKSQVIHALKAPTVVPASHELGPSDPALGRRN
jgi:hypothetical protein